MRYCKVTEIVVLSASAPLVAFTVTNAVIGDVVIVVVVAGDVVALLFPPPQLERPATSKIAHVAEQTCKCRRLLAMVTPMANNKPPSITITPPLLIG